AVGLDHVAVDLDGALAEALERGHGAQAAADEALDLLGAPGLLAARGLAVAAGVGCARQHAVLGGEPALTAALEERRHFFFDARGADDARVAELDQHRTFGVTRVAARDRDFSQLAGLACARTHGGGFLMTGELTGRAASIRARR